MNSLTLKDFRGYQNGSYGDMTLDERMYYVNLLKEADDHSSYSYHISTGFDDERFVIGSDIEDFFEDALVHIGDKLRMIPKRPTFTRYDDNDFGNLTMIAEKRVKGVGQVKFLTKDTLRMWVVFEDKGRWYDFDPSFLDEDRLDAYIKGKIEYGLRQLNASSCYYKCKCDEINRCVEAYEEIQKTFNLTQYEETDSDGPEHTVPVRVHDE